MSSIGISSANDSRNTVPDASTDSFPRFIRVRQQFPAPAFPDFRLQLDDELPKLKPRLKAGARIAVGVGSRGISNLQLIVERVLAFLKAAGTQPFVVPAMGSHGGATPEGQIELLAEYGITEARLGVPIRAGMDARQIGVTPDGVEIFFSEEALQADGVLVINRVKPHTDFRSVTIGSGLLKMLVVGLGKRLGAAQFHTFSSRFGYEATLRAASRVTLTKANILGGVAIVENQFHDTARIALLFPEEMEAREEALFREAKQWMPQLPFDDIDLLIVDEIGKNISGSGMDPNVIGRSLHGYSALLSDRSTHPIVRRIFVRGLTPQSHGNGVGVGLADFTTTRLVQAINPEVTYLNALTAMSVQSVKIPIHFQTDREAITRALASLALRDLHEARIVRIQNTLALERVNVSEAYASAFANRPELIPLGPASALTLDANGNLLPLQTSHP
jgi:hypothetical protein